jgi:putative PIN family toxin of toxin-antitoxin system
MTDPSRLVFDANVIASALLFNSSVPGRALFAAIDRDAILISHALISQLNEVLSRPRFDRYVDAEQRQHFLARLIRDAELVTITEKINACRDPADNFILELAVSGKAHAIVTGDQDLLALNPFRGVAIVTPSEALTRLPP